MFRSKCRKQLKSENVKSCSGCGASCPQAAPTAAFPHQTPAQAADDRSASVWAIIIVVVLDVFGDMVNVKWGTTAFPIILWLAATIIGIYLVATKSIANRLVGAVKIIMFVLWLGSLVITRMNNQLSGNYMDEAGVITISFRSNGSFTMTMPDQNPTTGTYTVNGDHLTLDPSDGQAANNSNPSNALVSQAVGGLFEANLSSNCNHFDLDGDYFTKAQ